MTTDKAAAPVGAVPQGDDDEVGYLCGALGNMFAGDTLDRQQAEWLDEVRKMLRQQQADLASQAARMGEDTARLDFIERTFSGMTNRERYLPVQMVWGKGAMGRTLREACDKYMKRDDKLRGEAG